MCSLQTHPFSVWKCCSHKHSCLWVHSFITIFMDSANRNASTAKRIQSFIPTITLMIFFFLSSQPTLTPSLVNRPSELEEWEQVYLGANILCISINKRGRAFFNSQWHTNYWYLSPGPGPPKGLGIGSLISLSSFRHLTVYISWIIRLNN